MPMDAAGLSFIPTAKVVGAEEQARAARELAATQRRRAIRKEIRAIYQQHNRRKLGDLDALLAEWAGDEEE